MQRLVWLLALSVPAVAVCLWLVWAAWPGCGSADNRRVFMLPLTSGDGYKSQMATVKYFKKFTPNNPVIINDGKDALVFEGFDNVLGYFATDDEGIQNQFLAFMKAQRYGLSEISVAEFERDYMEKKRARNGSSGKPRQREEIRSSFKLVGNELPGADVRAALAVKGGSDIRRNVAPPIRMESPSSAPVTHAAEQAGAPAKKPEFVPTVGRRKAKTQ